MTTAPLPLQAETALSAPGNKRDPKKELHGLTQMMAGLRLTPLPHAGAAKQAAGAGLDFSLKTAAYKSAVGTQQAVAGLAPQLDFTSFARPAANNAPAKPEVAQLQAKRLQIEFHQQKHTMEAAAAVLRAPLAAKEAAVHAVREMNDQTRVAFSLADAGVANWCRFYGIDKAVAAVQRWVAANPNKEKSAPAIASYYGVSEKEARAYLDASNNALRNGLQTAASASAGTAVIAGTIKQLGKLGHKLQHLGVAARSSARAPAAALGHDEGKILSHSRLVLYRERHREMEIEIAIHPKFRRAAIRIDALQSTLPGQGYFQSALREVRRVAELHKVTHLTVESYLYNPRLVEIAKRRYGMQVANVQHRFLGGTRFEVSLNSSVDRALDPAVKLQSQVIDIVHGTSFKCGMHESTGTMLVHLDGYNAGSHKIDNALQVFKSIQEQAVRARAKQVVIYTNQHFADPEMLKYLQYLPRTEAPFGQIGYLAS